MRFFGGYRSEDSSSSNSDAGSEERKEDPVSDIDRLLRRPWRLRRHIGRVFRRSTDCTTPSGKRAVSAGNWPNIMAALAEDLDVPEWLFSNGAQLFERFDFDGDGVLRKYEFIKLVKYVLRQRRTELGGRQQEVSVPTSTLRAEGYTVLRELGRGGQGVMYLCSKSYTAHQFCVKFYNKRDANAGGIAELIDEYQLMKNLKSEYIAQTYDVFQDREFYYLVNEPYFGGDLTKLAKRAYDEGVDMTEDWWREIFRQCLMGVEYLHRKATMHCDIKEPNIMIADGGNYQAPRPVLIDFGLAEPFSRKESGINGTPGYIPPETWQSGHWYPLGDIYSMGIVFFQLMVGQVPSATGSVMGVLQPRADIDALRSAGLNPVLPWNRFPRLMPLLRELVLSMTSPTRTERLRAPQCLAHRWFSSKGEVPLPIESLKGLLRGSEVQLGGQNVVDQLVRENNLQELRRMRSKASHGTVSPTGTHTHRMKKLRALLSMNNCRADNEDNLKGRMTRLLDEAIWAKKQYSDHYIVDLFNELDSDHNRRLSVKELAALLDSDSFECPYHDIQDLISKMGPFDADLSVSFERFREVVLEDGRIARRCEAEGNRRCCLQ